MMPHMSQPLTEREIPSVSVNIHVVRRAGKLCLEKGVKNTIFTKRGAKPV